MNEKETLLDELHRTEIFRESMRRNQTWGAYGVACEACANVARRLELLGWQEEHREKLGALHYENMALYSLAMGIYSLEY